eukprot:m.311252 g.311252  ORF g.311252 m.311252 type:complete len:102 (+) comp63340_c0_seq1:68-373(+)
MVSLDSQLKMRVSYAEPGYKEITLERRWNCSVSHIQCEMNGLDARQANCLPPFSGEQEVFLSGSSLHRYRYSLLLSCPSLLKSVDEFWALSYSMLPLLSGC